MHNGKNNYAYSFSFKDKILIILKNIMKFLGNMLFIFFVAIILVMLFYSIYTKKTGNSGKPPLIGAYVIVSPSMVPTINVLDAIVSFRVNTNNLKIGDIITFSSSDSRYDGMTVTHRIIKTSDLEGEKVYSTKGDNNTTPDGGNVKQSEILGKVVFVVPWLGYIQYLLAKPLGWLILIVVPCVFLIVYDILKLKKVVQKSNKTKDYKFKDVEIKNQKKKK